MNAHADLSTTIEPKSDQLNADDLITGPRTIRVTDVRLLDSEQPVAIHFEGDNGKPFKPCKSMRRVLVQVWGGDGNQYRGREMTLFRDPTVKFGGADVGGIRISHMSHLDKAVTMALTVTRANRKPYRVLPLETTAAARDPFPDALAAGREGRDAFKAWWKAASKDDRAAVQPRLPEIEAAVKAADGEIAPATDAPTEPTVTLVKPDGSKVTDMPRSAAEEMLRVLCGDDPAVAADLYAKNPWAAPVEDTE